MAANRFFNSSFGLGLFLLSWSGYAVDLPLLWRWSNPGPHGANIVDQAANSALTVQVGERGQVYVSDDWDLWAPRDTYTSAALRGVTFFGGRLVITGEAGTVMYADDPWNFRGLALGTSDWLESVAASADLVVAVGDNAAIYTSTNALDWQRITPLFNQWLRSVASDGSSFVAVGEAGLIASSQNGTSWQVRPSGTTANLNRVAWMGDHYLVVGDSGLALRSADGTSWSPAVVGATNYLYSAAGRSDSQVVAGRSEVRLSENQGPWSDQLASTVAAPAPAWTYYSALWNSGFYLLSGHAGLSVEGARPDPAAPIGWRPLSESVRTWLWSVATSSTHFIAVGDHGTILSSPNGIDFDLELVPLETTNSVLLGVGGSPELMLAVGSRGTVLWATNVFVWHELSPKPTTNDLQGVCYDNGQFILSGGNGTVLASMDGKNWTRRATSTRGFLMSVAAFPGGLVTVGEDGTILTSNDLGQTWEKRISGTTNWLSSVRWLKDCLIAVGENGTLLTSTDGFRWFRSTTGTKAWLNAVEFFEDTWFVAGNQGTLLASRDATLWFTVPSLTKQSLYGLCVKDKRLIAVGSEGVILRSVLVSDETSIQIASYACRSGISAFLFTGAADQQFRLQSSTDLSTWTDGALLEFLDSSGTLIYVEETDPGASKAYYRTRRVR